VDLRIDSHRYYTSIERSDVDVAIRLGDGKWPEGVIIPLSRERLFPVCAPGLLQPGVEPAAALRGQIILHYAERPHWANWLRAAGLDPALGAQGPRFGETALALVAAEARQGIAIARAIHVRQAISEGRLVQPFSLSIDEGQGYFLVATEQALRRTTVKAFVEWCRSELVAPEESAI